MDHTPTRERVLDRFDRVNVWSRGSERAPHKPLLILYALGRWQRGEPPLLPFAEAESDLMELLREFGPPRKSIHPEYPFWYLQSDAVWALASAAPLTPRRGSSAPPKSQLLEHQVRGRFTDDVLSALRDDPSLALEIAQRMLDSHFPDSIHDEILAAVGLDLDRSTTARARRDPRFRWRVLTAYESRCALCEFDLRLGNHLIGLEAAHIKWHQAGGPDTEENGLALCVLHHKTFDLGAFSIRPDLIVLVSDQVVPSVGSNDALLRFHGAALRKPQRPEFLPRKEFLSWHEREVFKGRARHLAATSP